MESPEPPPRIEAFSNYPRYHQVDAGGTANRLPWYLRLARGFIIGNYWFGAFTVITMSFYFLSGAYKEHHTEHHNFDPAGLFLIVFFIPGFLIGSLTKRKTVPVILAGVSGFLAWIIWGAAIFQVDSSIGLLMFVPYTILSILLAILINRAATRSPVVP